MLNDSNSFRMDLLVIIAGKNGKASPRHYAKMPCNDEIGWNKLHFGEKFGKFAMFRFCLWEQSIA